MSLGLAALESMKSSKKDNSYSVTTQVAYPTPFMELNYTNGQRIEVYNDDDDVVETYDSVGTVEGTFITVIADSGLGKSTLVQQIAAFQASKFEHSFVVHEDVENAASMNRVINISKMKASWIKQHYTIKAGAHAEDIVSRFVDHALMKLNNRAAYEYDTGLRDLFGDKIIRLIPTFVIIDSLAVMRSSGIDFEANQDTNNMAGARNAKLNSEWFKQMLPYCKKANITIYVINHINRKIQTGFVQAPRDIAGLGADETISGGRAAIYLANNILRLKNKQTLKPDKDYGINGHIITAIWYKSRTNATLQEAELIFDKVEGFSPVLSLHRFCDRKNLFGGSAVKRCIPGLENIKFSKKEFKGKFTENSDRMGPALYDLVLPEMQKLLSTSSIYTDYESLEEKQSQYEAIMGQIFS